MNKIQKYYQHIKELFETKNYIWIKSNNSYQTTAKFDVNGKEYFLHFDEVMNNVYNLYFYYLNVNNEQIFNLINNNDNSSYKVLSNVKNATDDFIISHKNIQFLGFSADEKERIDLYTLFLQNISNNGFNYKIKKIKNKTYFFLIHKNVVELLSDLYINNFIQNDEKIKSK
jgi:hypothetical protein